ncbi:PAS domain S-box-containing protein [Novosphingobium sp. PhB165]|uniref:hybrid sensor histidine kinase/response regulator n=1 Tax=Novosphingobium sp. PhB165 TaxID=2485105 RepID=UPI00104F61ED|nr:hybrid sensor histidine kinase/response regulator [Novosphingobium sp. PhB165]TCM20640.1 PAS domain S-box-containing protein [Novosphingobium sp. PhB165]
MPELRESLNQDQLRAVLAAAGASGSWDWDIVGERLYVDYRFAELYALPGDDLSAGFETSAFFRAIHPEDRPRIRIAVAGMLAGAALFSKEFRVISPSGAVLWMHGRGQSHLDEDDQPVRFTGLLVDVTERKRTEERLRIAQSAGGVGTFEYSDGFATVSVSSEFCRLLGLHPADRLPVRTINAVLCEGEPLLIPEGSQAAPPDSLGGEFQVCRGEDRERRWIARRGEVLRDADGSGYRLLGVIYDVTYAKLQEAALRDLNDTLEHRVAMEVAERRQAEEALRQAQKMEAVGQLTGGIAHDFNNLLTIIMGSVDMAIRRTESSADPRIRRALDNAMKGAERAAALTHRLLAFSRRQPLDPRAVNVPELLAGMSDLLLRTITEAIAITVDASDEIWTIEADPHQLENALLNLAVNARDAMPEGGALRITARNRSLSDTAAASPTDPGGEIPAGDYVAIDVVDTGTGMDETTLGQVFDPFFTTKEVGKGTGLGLSMVYGFAKQSGGGIQIASRPGAGTCVSLYLPRSIAEAEQSSDQLIASAEMGSPSETILVVEDDDDVRAYTVGALRDLGYGVIEAHDGASALGMLARHEQPIRLLMTDVVMPRMSGSELAFLARERQAGLAVLFTSGYTRDAIMHGGRLDEGVELLPKPFTMKNLASKVRELLDR